MDAGGRRLRHRRRYRKADAHDWDSTEDPVLVDLKMNGGTVKALFHANRSRRQNQRRPSDVPFPGKQYLAVASADSIIAFALPDQ